MSQPNTSQFPLKFEFGDDEGSQLSESYDDAISWLSGLQNEWSWVALSGQYNFQNVWNRLNDQFAEPISLFNQAKNYRIQGQFDAEKNHLDAAKLKFEQSIKQFPWILDSAQRNYVRKILADGSTEIASATVAHWLQSDLTGIPPQFVVPAILKWELYNYGIDGRFEQESKILKQLAGEMRSALTEIKISEIKQTNEFDVLSLLMSEQTASSRKEFEQVQAEQEAAWNAQLERSNLEFENIRNTYDKHMALAAPVDYWDTKRKKHQNWTLWTFILLLISLIVSGFLLVAELQAIGKSFELVQGTKIVSQAIPKAEPTTFASMIQTAATMRLGAFLLLSTLVFWMLRLLVRVLLSHMHLENDAAERVVMAKTYLALIRDGNLPKSESINMVLAALFRPSGDGIVKDEGVPPTTLDWFTKLGK